MHAAMLTPMRPNRWPNHTTILNFVGDDDQSINGWLLAMPNAMKALGQRYVNHRVLTMDVTL